MSHPRRAEQLKGIKGYLSLKKVTPLTNSLKSSISESPVVKDTSRETIPENTDGMEDKENDSKLFCASRRKRDLNECEVTAMEEPAHKRFQHLLGTSLNSSKVQGASPQILDEAAHPIKLAAQVYDPKLAEFDGLTPNNTPNTTPKILKTVSPAISVIGANAPAFKKYSHLVDEIKSPSLPLLPLPDHYQQLEKMFHALETCILFVKARDQKVVFHKIKKSVENICNRNFELSNLAQMVHVDSNLYRLEPIRFYQNGHLTESLVVDFPLNQMNNNSNLQLQAQGMHQYAARRRKDFHNELLKLTILFHEKFSNERNLHAKNSLIEWNPLFPLHSAPEIPSAELPSFRSKPRSSPVNNIETVNSSVTEQIAVSDGNCRDEKPNSRVMSKSDALLERIKKKQSTQALAVNKRKSPENMKLLSMLSRMSEVIVAITMCFVSQKKKVLSFTELCEHIQKSHSVPVSVADSEMYIRYLSELEPDWLQIVQDAKLLVSLNRDFKTAVVLEKIVHRRRELTQ